jgi:hypothetical protein
MSLSAYFKKQTAFDGETLDGGAMSYQYLCLSQWFNFKKANTTYQNHLSEIKISTIFAY